MAANNNITQLDTDQCIKYSFDEENRAQRVYVINDNSANNIVPAITSTNVEIREIKVPEIIKEKEIQVVYIDKPIIQEKIVEIEKPVFIEKIVIQEIKVPEIVKEIVFVSKEQTNKELPLFMKVCMITQILVMIGMLLSNVIRK